MRTELPWARDVDRVSRLPFDRRPSDAPLPYRVFVVSPAIDRVYAVEDPAFSAEVSPLLAVLDRLMLDALEREPSLWPRRVTLATDQQVGLFVRPLLPRLP